jgi:predicted kinase
MEQSAATEHPMLIVMAGLPGTGKSELAAEISRRLHIPMFSVDPVESAILRAGVKKRFETGLAAYLVVEALADAQLALGLGAIVDAVNAETPAKDTWRGLSVKHRLNPMIIECHCSNEVLHRQRLSSRARRFKNLLEPTWDDVQMRRLAYTPWREPVFSVDAVLPLETNVAQVLAWLEAGGRLNSMAPLAEHS